MAVNWSNLRCWNGSQQLAFEELCCQLAFAEPHPPNARFFRKGTPDAGVECFWRLPNGDEWAWQAKFFRSVPSAQQWRQIDDSVKKALEKHPRLSKYTVCLPIDRPDKRVGNEKSCLQKWNERVAKWQASAAKKQMSVEFEYWGQSQIAGRLSNETHRGRHWFWFTEERLSDSWFIDRVNNAVANARDRYTPELNVDLPIRAMFDALGRTPAFFERLERLYSAAAVAFRKLRRADEPKPLRDKYERLFALAPDLMGKLQPWVTTDRHYSEWTITRPIPWDEIGSLADAVIHAASDCVDQIYELKETAKKQKNEAKPSSDDLDSQFRGLCEFRAALYEIDEYMRSDQCKLANTPALLLVGQAGQGKTHLLCHIGKHETNASRPVLLFHGENFFRQHEPWSRMIGLLGLTCPEDEFIGALEAAAQANNCRVLVFIDALNEGDGNRLWSRFLPGMLTKLAQSQWLGVCVSVRSCYEQLVIPRALDETRIARIEHTGFADRAYNAAAKFFAHFGIEPSTPLLLPEFDNPLFLKLFCRSLRNAPLSRVPSGLRGITAIFRFFVESIDDKLARPEALDYDPRSRVVVRAVEHLADEMAKRKSDRLPLEEAKSIVNGLLPREGHEGSLFRHLESEGVLTTVPDFPRQGEAGNWTERVRFTYQRFSDHLITQRLLKRYLDKRNPNESFSKRRTLGKLVKDERACCANRGIIEALAIQLPETAGTELPHVAPHLAELRPVREAFVQGIVWRDPRSFTDATYDYINKEVLAWRGPFGPFDTFWNAVISLATVPDHPLNADRLHAMLNRLAMADRDRWWSVFLHHEWDETGAVDRLVQWAWDDNDKSVFDDEVVRLAGVALGWFFTTANRFLRDAATKGLVRLCENRLHVLRQVIDKLRQVDDPYVAERLYAAAYGCAMRTTDADGLAELANDVYGWVFASGEPPPHILLRDYARGVIEVALQRGAQLDVDPAKFRPPYRSAWPCLEVPALDDLKAWGEWEEGMPDDQWARVDLYRSVMGDGDFSRYEIGRFDEWSSESLHEPHKPTHEELHDQFVASLTERQKEAWDLYCTVRQNVEHCRGLKPERRKEALGAQVTDAQLDTALQEAEERLVRALRRHSNKCRLFREVVAPYVAEPHAYYRENAFDGQLARRWMMQRIIDLGWTVERFGQFDRDVNRYRMGRDTNKPERIGKKYQWIALHELLARLSDNFKLREESWSVRSAEYHGPWDVHVRRDLDPSSLLRRTGREEWCAYTNTWWFPTPFDAWDDPIDEVAWLKEKRDLPDARDVISVTNPEDGAVWFTLEGFYSWQQPTPPGEERYDAKYRDLWYMLRCYLVKEADAAELLKWARPQSWMGRWMPESHTCYDVFLGEFFWSPVFAARDCAYFHRDGWTRGDYERIPCDVLVANDEYGRESGGYDCSVEHTILVNMPCRFLADGMNLQWRGVEGNWYDPNGQLAAFDPSVRCRGPQVLLFRRDLLLDFLRSRELTLFWTLLGERRTLGGSISHDDHKGHLEINGAYVWKDGKLSGGMRSKFVEPGSRR